MKGSSSLFRSIGASWIGTAASVVIGMALSSYVGRTLGPELYGTWALALSIAAQCIIFDFGIRGALVRLISESRARNDSIRITDLLSTASLALIGSALVSTVVLFCIAQNNQLIFHGSESTSHLLLILIAILAIDAALELACGIFDAGLAAAERYDILSALNVVRLLLQSAFIVAALVLGYGVIGMVVGAVCARVIYRLLMQKAFRASYSSIDFSPLRWTPVAAKHLRAICGGTFLVALGGRIIYNADVIVASIFMEPAIVALYAAPVILIEQFRALAQSSGTVLLPRFSALAANNKAESSKILIEKWLTFGMLLAAFAAVPFIISGPDFMRLWMGDGFAGSGIVLQLLSVPFFAVIPSLALGNFLLSTGRQNDAAAITIAEALANLSISLILAQSMGIVGVALGTVIPALIFRGVVLPIKALPLCGLSAKRYIDATYVRPFLITTVYAATLFVLHWCLGANSWFTFIVQNALGAGVFVALTFRLVLNDDEKQYLRRRCGLAQP